LARPAAAVIQARLEAYFGDHRLVADWGELATVLTRFYALVAIRDEGPRRSEITRLLTEEGVESDPLETDGWGRLKEAILHHSQRISREILASPDMTLGG
jgi:hypothetical protein